MQPALLPILAFVALLAGPEVHDPAAASSRRREGLAKAIGTSYALLLGQPMTDVLQPRQEGHFLYLTGVTDPDSYLLLAGARATPLDGAREILFLREATPRVVQFYGLRHRPGPRSAAELQIETVRACPPGGEALAGVVAGLLPKQATLFLPGYRGADQILVRATRRVLLEALHAARPDLKIADLRPLLVRMRAVKSPEELALLTRAIRITEEAFREALPRIRVGSSEEAVDGALLGAVRRRGGRPAYPFVVAGGVHSTVPHYFRNQGPLRAGALLLIDAGASFHRYAADISRTIPVSGTFTPRQREVYRAVLEAQAAAIAAVKPGATFKQVDAAARRSLAQKKLATYFIHGIGHPVGIDVHDPGPRTLLEGMTITVEPGVYLAEEGFGIRIEDIVLVTARGCRVLTTGLPKDPDSIERLVREAEAPR